MAKKKRTLKAEVVDEAGGVNLTGTTRLEFALNKNDIIDFYCADEEEKLEAEIGVAAKQLSDADNEIEALRIELLGDEEDQHRAHNACPDPVEKALLKKHKSVISAVKKALVALNKSTDALANLGQDHEENEACAASEDVKVCVYLNADPESTERRHYYDPIFPWTTAKKGRKVLRGYRRQLGRNVPESKLHELELCQQFWQGYSHMHTAKDVLFCTLKVGNYSSAVLKFEMEDALKTQINILVDKMNARAPLVKKLHDLLIMHAELPGMKKQIKKQVVGRVLKNTDEGKLLLTALKGIRKSGVKLLTDSLSE
jgi:hypothetical protein